MVKCIGQLQHHFWYDYHATIVLLAPDSKSADQIAELLGENWTIFGVGHKYGVYFRGKNHKLEGAIKQLCSFGADRKKITSLAKSIDFGEKFDVNIPL